ncbi:hypothetical protein [Streptomyces olivaceus]|uniref:hypothetical protein n=1 Tax=Streptomyces olivaceus TaxID=47716 RepID=UPI0022EDD060|nr:hypothetical protein [Streptomyces olivaceus]GHI95199.1 hypothetical protein TPA0905_46700 [Streptomyces olivaceus]
MTPLTASGTPPASPGLRVRDLARTRGTAPALRELLGAPVPQALPHAPHGFALLPLNDPERPEDPEDPERPDGPKRAGAPEHPVKALRTYPLPGGPVALVRVPRPGPGDRRAQPFDPSALLWLRLGLAEGLLHSCVGHLGDRPSGDSTVLLQPLVKAQLAEAAAEQAEFAAWLGGGLADGVPASRLRRPHDRLTRNGRALLRLFGAHGFMAEGPGGVAHVSELLADVHQDVEGAR